MTLNSYDFLLNPKPKVIKDAIIITKIVKIDKKNTAITGVINVIARGGENKNNDKVIKDYVIKGKFCIKHKN